MLSKSLVQKVSQPLHSSISFVGKFLDSLALSVYPAFYSLNVSGSEYKDTSSVVFEWSCGILDHLSYLQKVLLMTFCFIACP